MLLGVENKAALVMASSEGLGKGIAKELSREGADVMLFSRSEDKLRKAQREIYDETGRKPRYTVGDALKADDIARAVHNTVQASGHLYALVVNAGGPPPGAFDDFNDAAWQKAYELCLLSGVRAVRAAKEHLKKAGGRILFSTSASVKTVPDNLILSTVFRLGVTGLSKTLSQEMAGDGVLVNVLAPGRIFTERIDQLDHFQADREGISLDAVRGRQHAHIPLGRYGTTDEYGRMAAFLLSPANSYLTGQIILLDGGLVKSF